MPLTRRTADPAVPPNADNKVRILVVEDDIQTAHVLTTALKSESHRVDVARKAGDAIRKLQDYQYDLIVLELILPDKLGIDVLRQIRRWNNHVLVFVLSRLSRVGDRVKGLQAGADDYLTKPFSVREFVARVRALLRRREPSPPARLRVDDLEMDLLERTVWRARRRIELSAKEFALLECLMQNAGHTVTRTMIKDRVWNLSSDRDGNVVDVYISYLRRKIDRGFSYKLIHTVQRAGYCLGEPKQTSRSGKERQLALKVIRRDL